MAITGKDCGWVPNALRRTLLLVCLLCPLVAAAQNRPNIVLIVADDIGYSDFGAFGGEIETPTIDALAAEGVRFSNFHAASSCAPTRAMLLTGVDSHLAGVGSMRELMPLSHRGKPGYDGVLNNRVQTVASLLRDSGYRTSVAGKWHLGTEDRNLPAARGFDYSVIQADSGSDNFEMRPYLPMQSDVYWYENGQRMSALPEDFYSSQYFVDKTIEFLSATATEHKPFFAYLAFQANHTPIQAPAAFIDQYRGRYTQGWAEVAAARIQKLKAYGLIDAEATLAAAPSQDSWNALSAQQQYFEARSMQAYAGMATAMDYEIGRFVRYLRETGQYDNTVFIVLSDNGATIADAYENPFGRRWIDQRYSRDVETLGEKGSWIAAGGGWGRVANTPFSGYKFYAGEGGVRVPLIVSGLSSIDADTVQREFVYVTDLAPTLLDIAGVDQPQPVEGREPITGKSLLPLLEQGASTLRSSEESIGYEFSGSSALYRGAYKLVRDRPPAGDSQWRLYDISKDPGETVDLSAQLPDLYRAMHSAYAAYERGNSVLPLPENYSVAKQVLINKMVYDYLPRYGAYVLALVVLIIIFYGYRRRHKKGRG